MAKLQCVVILSVVAAAISTASAISDEDKTAIKAELIPLIAECGKELEISKDDVKAAKEAADVDALSPCFYACILKKRGIINDEGNYSPDVAKAEHAKFVHDEEIVGKLDAISDDCASVNDEATSDGAKGCEKAKQLVNCFIKNKDIFTLIFKE